jgi:outer membrane protein OmpA-like peptidoglycan-associated protein
LPIAFGLGLQADLSFGGVLSQIVHYETAIDMMMGNAKTSKSASSLLGGRLYATYSIKNKSIKFYAGGGVDIMFETEKPIPLPVLEAGISIKPFSLIRRSTVRKDIMDSEKHTFKGLDFENNTVSINEQIQDVLDETGGMLIANPDLQITLRAYYAPSGTSQWQIRWSDGTPALSAARAGWCIDYLVENFGIAKERISIEYTDADNATELYNCVEIILK